MIQLAGFDPDERREVVRLIIRLGVKRFGQPAPASRQRVEAIQDCAILKDL
jgi:hypothetical protein